MQGHPWGYIPASQGIPHIPPKIPTIVQLENIAMSLEPTMSKDKMLVPHDKLGDVDHIEGGVRDRETRFRNVSARRVYCCDCADAW